MLKSQATKIETRYKTNIGAANNNMLGISLVGDRTAALIMMTIKAVFQIRTMKPAVTRPIRANTYVTAGIWNTTPIPSRTIMMKSK